LNVRWLDGLMVWRNYGWHSRTLPSNYL